MIEVQSHDNPVSTRCNVAVVTGTRAEFGLLQSVMHAIQDQSPQLNLQVVVTGLHLLADADTRDEVASTFPIAADVTMQRSIDMPNRENDVQAVARGIAGFGDVFEALDSQVVLVLGDRIEAFAAASAASIGGRRVAHIHGGDRAEGVADEAMRHAITKLAHIHFPASVTSAERILKLGESSEHIHMVGSPAIDLLANEERSSPPDLTAFGIDVHKPFAIVLQHPCGLPDDIERLTMNNLIEALDDSTFGSSSQYLLCDCNRDAGYDSIAEVRHGRPVLSNVPRSEWIAILRRAQILIGNSSAGLIECPAIGTASVNVGPRQNGRERSPSVFDVPQDYDDVAPTELDICRAIDEANSYEGPFDHPFGDGSTGLQIAVCLVGYSENLPTLRKCNSY